MSILKSLFAKPAALVALAGIICAILILFVTIQPKPVTAQTTLPFTYLFSTAGTLIEAPTAAQSSSPYFWLQSGGSMTIASGVGSTVAGSEKTFQLFSRTAVQNVSAQLYVERMKDNLSNAANMHPYNGESVIARYVDDNNYYFAGIRADGYAIIKKKTNGLYQTLATKKLFAGTYSTATPDLIPLGKWIGLKLVVADTASGPQLNFYTDQTYSGAWQLALSITDDSSKFGAAIKSAGLAGIQSDFADVKIDNFSLNTGTAISVPTVAPQTTPVISPVTSPVTSPMPTPTTSYDSLVLAASPVMYLTMGGAGTSGETDKTGHGHNGTYKGGATTATTLPNGDKAAVFNGSSSYLTVPSSAALSIPTTKTLTWEGWVRADTFNFPVASDDGYVDWMGKCQDYSPTCEWEARVYGNSTAQGRPTRLSAYVFNTSAGLGSAADWQPSTALAAGKWVHVVAEYQTTSTPSGCSSSYPGSINIWVNGVKQSFADHAPTGCMSQYSVTPKTNNSPLNIGTMSMDTWFKGAVGKVAVYNRLLSQTEINQHFTAMTGQTPSGSCGATCTAVTVQ